MASFKVFVIVNRLIPRKYNLWTFVCRLINLVIMGGLIHEQFLKILPILQAYFPLRAALCVISCILSESICSSLLTCIIDNLHKVTALKRQFVVCQIFSTDVRWSTCEINLPDKLPRSHIRNT
jgi:hypothetical protein